MKKIRSYSSPKAVGHRLVDDVLDGEVVVQEKIDGSQISFGIYDNELKIRSKNAMRDLDESSMFNKAIDTIKSISSDLVPGWTYRGEYLSKPKHNTKKYERVPAGNVILFDIDTGHQHYVLTQELANEARLLGLECVPTLYQGDKCTIKMLEELLENTMSILGKDVHIEGVVVKNYSKFIQDKVMMGKLVSEKFQEKHKVDWKKSNPSAMAKVVEAINKEAVWEKAIQHLRDDGKLVNEPKDIGLLIPEIKEDFIREQEEFIKKIFFNHYKRKILKRITAGFPEYYKKRLRLRLKGEKNGERY